MLLIFRSLDAAAVVANMDKALPPANVSTPHSPVVFEVDSDGEEEAAREEEEGGVVNFAREFER